MRSLRGISFLLVAPIDIRWMRHSSVNGNEIHLLLRVDSRAEGRNWQKRRGPKERRPQQKRLTDDVLERKGAIRSNWFDDGAFELRYISARTASGGR